jgi:hypothetical protein
MPGRLKMELVFRRRVEFGRTILDKVFYQDSSALRFHLSKHIGTINDVYWPDGSSSLHWALDKTRKSPSGIEKVKDLLAAGADPDYPDDNGISPCEMAALDVFMRKSSAETLSELSTLFSVSSIMEDLKLTFIHKIVIGICQVDLSEVTPQEAPQNNFAIEFYYAAAPAARAWKPRLNAAREPLQ